MQYQLSLPRLVLETVAPSCACAPDTTMSFSVTTDHNTSMIGPMKAKST